MTRLLVLLALVLVPSAASAFTMAEKVACKDDAQKFCSGIKPGEGRILECLAPNKDKLTDGCRKVVEATCK
jgi:hypothetical protein